MYALLMFQTFIAVAFICGIVFGPLCAKFVDVQSWGNEEIITHEFTRIVIGIQVMACGVTLPKAYLRKELKSLLMLLGPTMIYMWLISGLLVWALIPGLNYVKKKRENSICNLFVLIILYSLRHS